MRMTLAQYLLKHNCRTKHHDRLFYGKYLYSQRIFLPISHHHRSNWQLYDATSIDDANPMGDWVTTNNAIANLKQDAKQNQRDIKFRREGSILHLYSRDCYELDYYVSQVKQIFADECTMGEISCSPPIMDKNIRVRKTLPHNRYKNEIVLRAWRYGRSTVATTDGPSILKFYNTYQGQVWNESIDCTGVVETYDYVSLFLLDDSLVPVSYLYFGDAVQKVLTYKLESEIESENQA